MIEHCLYGMKVFSEFPLYDRSVLRSAVAPGEHPALELRPAVKNTAALLHSECIPLGWTHERELFLRTDRKLGRSVPGQSWSLEVRDVVVFDWTGGDPVVYHQLQQEGTLTLLVFWFVHIFLPLYLTLERGWDFIHASAVEIDAQPVMFIAPSTGGKSTLANYFLRQGHPMLSDDKVATFLYDSEYWVVPSHPHHRPYRRFEVLGDAVENFATRACPVQAFYILKAGEPDATIEISEVIGFRKFECLLPNYLYSFSYLQQQRLRWLAQLADTSLVFQVHRPWNLDRMDEVYQAICHHTRSQRELSV